MKVRCSDQRGIAVTEFALLFPLLVAMVMALVDVSRMVYTQQRLNDLSRETANLVSRGTSIDSAINSVLHTSEVFDLDENSLVIVSRVRRRAADDPTPWVSFQTAAGISVYRSRVGDVGSIAKIPGVASLPQGVTVTTVELVQDFDPLFPAVDLGLDFYPEQIYQAAYY
jgi:hypothetical protein